MNPRAATLPDTSIGIGRMCPQMIDPAASPISTPADLVANKIQFVWAASDAAASAALPGVACSYYIPCRMDNLKLGFLDYPTNQQPDPGTVAEVGSFAWYQANHPDFVAYGPDYANLAGPVSRALEYGENRVPIDIANGAARADIWTRWLQAALSRGYNSISLDSITAVLTYFPPSVVIRNGHYQSDGITYTTQYNPANAYDAQFAADVIAMIQDYAARVQSAGKLLAGNLTLNDPNTLTTHQTILNSLDIWLDERTATNYGGERLNGAAWLSHQQNLAEKAKLDAIALDSYCNAVDDAHVTSDDLIWALANYLTVKGQRSYLSVAATSKPGASTNWQHPEFDAVQAIGTPLEDCYQWNGVYARVFSGGYVLVNPGLETAVVPLPAYEKTCYRDLYGVQVNSPLVLAATTAAVLLTGRPLSSPEYNTIGWLRIP